MIFCHLWKEYPWQANAKLKQQNSWHWNNLLQLFSPHLLPDEGLTDSFLLLNIFSQNLFPIKKPPSVIYKFVNT